MPFETALQTDISPFQRWLDSCTHHGDGAVGHSVATVDLYLSYKSFMVGAGHRDWMSFKVFGLALSQHQVRHAGLQPETGLHLRGPIRFLFSEARRPRDISPSTYRLPIDERRQISERLRQRERQEGLYLTADTKVSRALIDLICEVVETNLLHVARRQQATPAAKTEGGAQ